MKFRLRHILLLTSLLAFIYSCQDDPIEVGDSGQGNETPKTGARINLVQLNDFPDLDPNGISWDPIDTTSLDPDPEGRADISFTISTPNDPSTVLWSQGTHFSNVAPADTVPFYLLTPYDVVPFGSTIDVNVYDFESPDSTWMGKVSFVIDQYPDPDHPWPSYVTASEGGYSVTIGITWLE